MSARSSTRPARQRSAAHSRWLDSFATSIHTCSLDEQATAHGTFFAPRAYEIDSLSRLEREVFGPILHIIRWRAEDLDQVCEAIANTGYGLTLGIHSRIDETIINGLTLGSIYGLIAIGYTMVYGIIGMINFAHGDVFMIGAFIAMIAFLVLGWLGISWIPGAAGRADHGSVAADRDVWLDGRAHRLPAAARLVPPGAADLGDRHVDLPAELRAAAAGRPRQAAAADSSAASTLLTIARLRRVRWATSRSSSSSSRSC
jgi:hypothetical protein